MSLTPNRFHDCHIFSLPSQGSVYTLCRLPNINPYGRTRLLAASLRKPVYLLEFNHGYKSSLVPYSRELSFTNIPGVAEIVSITSFSKPGSSNTIIGVTYLKKSQVGNERNQFLNLYILKEIGPELNADGLAFSGSVEITYIPYHLTHCPCSTNDIIFALSGSDYKVHLYSEDSITHVVQERDPHEFFPEFIHEFPSVALWIDFHIIPEKDLRCTSVGCECGTLFLYIVDIKSNAIIHNYRINLGSSMTSSKFFYMNQTLNLLVTNALLPACVYSNILNNGLSVSSILIGSEKHDIITCSLVCDIQMDQQPTILLGTYGQELLAYRYCSDSMWILAWQRSFSHPILSLDYCDVTGDGVRELVALTTRGVQILQHDLHEVALLFLRRLESKENPSRVLHD